ncbi:MAG: HEAT repeat domain-containing protein [Firmicutes bacterium]|nr:HEAT repeat domain-containing protein [Bacillota bacterium]
MTESQENKIDQISSLKAELNDQSLEKILGYLQDKDQAVKLSAIEALSAFTGHQKAKHALIKILKEEDPEYRYYAIEALGEFSGEDAENAVIERLNDNDELIRIEAIQALGYIDSKRSIPFIQELLNDKKELVRSYAAAILGGLGGKDLIPVLEKGLREEKRNAARIGYYEGLYLLGQSQYLKDLIKMLKTKSYKNRCAAANILVAVADKYNYILINDGLKKALERERTVAARSSIQMPLSR